MARTHGANILTVQMKIASLAFLLGGDKKKQIGPGSCLCMPSCRLHSSPSATSEISKYFFSLAMSKTRVSPLRV